jgi:predicted RNA-binding Zn ribbon-like protein
MAGPARIVKWILPPRAVRIAGVSTSAPLMGEPWPVELMNTVWADRDGQYDALDDDGEARAWLAEARSAPVLTVAGTSDDDRAALPRLRELRDALRRLAADVTGDPRTSWRSPVGSDEAVARLDEIAAAAPTWPALERAGDGALVRVTRSAASSADAAVSLIAQQGVELFTEGGPTLRACLAPGCVLYFVAHHPRREWCSAGCGNRARVARHYRRHRGSPAAT